MIHLQAKLFADLDVGGPVAVRNALQQAIKLEHATIPLYLYALYSLDRAKNSDIANVVKSVVMEEMLHMTLSSNVLNALGGSPEIDSPGFVPTYPGPLPGGVAADLTVHLAPFSPAQLNVFLKIEEPETPLSFPVTGAGQPPLTIGRFYAEIKRQIAALGDGALSSMPRNQIDSNYIAGAVVVTNVQTAGEAIDTIVEQGEGTKVSPLEAATGDAIAHYYRFMEIFHGKRLLPNPNAGPETPADQRYAYSGEAVLFDAAGVFPVPTDPLTAGYPAGSPARHACDKFNFAYSSILKWLHTGFNGQPDDIDSAIGAMPSLGKMAKGLMAGTLVPGINVGPSFEYQPLDPG
jgi:Ferritin-like